MALAQTHGAGIGNKIAFAMASGAGLQRARADFTNRPTRTAGFDYKAPSLSAGLSKKGGPA